VPEEKKPWFGPAVQFQFGSQEGSPGAQPQALRAPWISQRPARGRFPGDARCPEFFITEGWGPEGFTLPFPSPPGGTAGVTAGQR